MASVLPSRSLLPSWGHNIPGRFLTLNIRQSPTVRRFRPRKIRRWLRLLQLLLLHHFRPMAQAHTIVLHPIIHKTGQTLLAEVCDLQAQLGRIPHLRSQLNPPLLCPQARLSAILPWLGEVMFLESQRQEAALEGLCMRGLPLTSPLRLKLLEARVVV